MKAAALYFSLAFVLIVILRVRVGARRARTQTLTRLTEETAVGGVLSPTEELFRSEGVPISDELRRGLATAPPEVAEPKLTAALQSAAGAVRTRRTESATPTATTPPPPLEMAAALVSVVDGIQMPCDLVPVTAGSTSVSASFVTAGHDTTALTAALSGELTRIGAEVTWIDGTTATARRAGNSAVITVYEHPDQVRDADGTPSYPTTTVGQVVVKLTAV